MRIGILAFSLGLMHACVAQSINPNQITPGTFQNGTYSFPGSVSLGGSGTAAVLNSIVSACSQPGSDAASQMMAAKSLLPVTGGIIDARCYGATSQNLGTQSVDLNGPQGSAYTVLCDRSTRFNISGAVLSGNLPAFHLTIQSTIDGCTVGVPISYAGDVFQRLTSQTTNNPYALVSTASSPVSGSLSMAVASLSGIYVGDAVTESGGTHAYVPAGTVVSGCSPSCPATASGTVTLTVAPTNSGSGVTLFYGFPPVLNNTLQNLTCLGPGNIQANCVAIKASNASWGEAVNDQIRNVASFGLYSAVLLYADTGSWVNSELLDGVAGYGSQHALAMQSPCTTCISGQSINQNTIIHLFSEPASSGQSQLYLSGYNVSQNNFVNLMLWDNPSGTSIHMDCGSGGAGTNTPFYNFFEGTASGAVTECSNSDRVFSHQNQMIDFLRAQWIPSTFQSVNIGPNRVYRCTSAGSLAAGALTILPGDCGASTDTGLTVK